MRGPRMLWAYDELDALAPGSVVLDGDGIAWQLDGGVAGGWQCAGLPGAIPSWQLMARGPSRADNPRPLSLLHRAELLK